MKKYNKGFLAGLLAALTLILTVGPTFAAGTPATQARSGVVRVVVPYQLNLYDPSSGKYAGTLSGYGSGSAFGAGEAGQETDYFVSNRHVVSLEDGLLNYDGVTYYGQYSISGYYILLDNYAYHSDTWTLDTSRAIPCTVVYLGESDDADVAVLRAAEKVSGRTALPLQDSEDTLEVGDTVTALGYPGSSDSATSEGYLLATVDDVTVTSGTVSRFFDSVSVTANSDSLTGRLIQSTASINGGNSGGPLVDENGAVVGINTYTYHGGSQNVTNAYYALRVQYAKTALDSLGVKYDVYTPGSNTALIAVAAAIVLVIAVAAFLVIRKKRAGAAKKEAAPIMQPAPTPDMAMAGAAQAGGAGAGSHDSGYRIQGVSGALEGRRFLIPKQGTVILGRDPEQCGVVFPANTPGVSARHCAVWFADHSVYIKDLGSSHGTFLAPGRRLAAEQAVRLNPGEVFYLGSQAQSFVIAERRQS